MRSLVTVAIAALALMFGVFVAPFVAQSRDRRPIGQSLRCIVDGRACVGMNAAQVLSFSSDDYFGGLTGVICGYTRPGYSFKETELDIAHTINGGCNGGRYAAEFSDGQARTIVWVDKGVVIRLDRDRIPLLNFQS